MDGRLVSFIKLLVFNYKEKFKRLPRLVNPMLISGPIGTVDKVGRIHDYMQRYGIQGLIWGGAVYALPTRLRDYLETINSGWPTNTRKDIDVILPQELPLEDIVLGTFDRVDLFRPTVRGYKNIPGLILPFLLNGQSFPSGLTYLENLAMFFYGDFMQFTKPRLLPVNNGIFRGKIEFFPGESWVDSGEYEILPATNGIGFVLMDGPKGGTIQKFLPFKVVLDYKDGSAEREPLVEDGMNLIVPAVHSASKNTAWINWNSATFWVRKKAHRQFILDKDGNPVYSYH